MWGKNVELLTDEAIVKRWRVFKTKCGYTQIFNIPQIFNSPNVLQIMYAI